MTLVKSDLDEPATVVAPVVEWATRNLHPHCAIVISDEMVTVTEAIGGLHITIKEGK